MKAAFYIIPILLLIAGGVYFLFQNWQAKKTGLPEGIITSPINKGSIITKVGSTGKVRANQIVTLSWQTSGTVGKVNVKNSDQVKAGDVLLELDPGSLKSSVLKAMQDLPAAQRALDSLEVSEVKRTQAKEDLANAEIAYKNAKDTRELKNQRNTSDTNLEVALGTYLQAKANLKSVETFFAFLQDRPEDDLTRAQVTAQLSLARKNYDWALWNYQYAQSKPLPEDVKIADANLKVAEATLADAKRNWEKVKDKPDPDDVTTTKANVDALQAEIGKIKITSPIDGWVTESKMLPGDIVKTGQQALVIVDKSRMFLDISISEVDINRIHLGRDVTFTFDAIPDKTYEGTITEISSVGTSIQEIIYYTVTCEVKKIDIALKPGMTAAASIQDEKVDNVLLVPNKSIITKNSQRIVMVVRNDVIVQIPVELGLVSENNSELKSGDLHEGDLVITNPKSLSPSASGK
ncbi:MAG TPA: efflux RND transporter periplasmic adaptor subunit [Leptolinea sp.]